MQKRLLHPRHWPSWLLVGFMRLLGLLPFPLIWGLGMALGRSAGRLAGSRRLIALRNLEICFPDLTPRERSRIASLHFGYLGVAVLMQGMVWGISRRRLARLVKFRNLELFEKLRGEGRGIIFMSPHFFGIELAGTAITARLASGMYMYQKIRNPVLDYQVRSRRVRFGALPVERAGALRTMVRELRKGTPFFYLPDQDAGRRRGIFVPFCGVPAATVPMLSRFAALTDVAVIPTYARFRSWGRGLEVIFDPPLAPFPSDDQEADTTLINRVIEARIRTMPAQYFWVHRRFKTRPPGEPPIYPPKRRRRR